MADELTFEGRKYISAKHASRLTGYTKDYIGQLSRAGKVRSRMVGRVRFVDEEDVLHYKNDLVLDGKCYISTKDAADITGYTSDYIGQLSRSGKISSTVIGKDRYVGKDSLVEYFKKTKKPYPFDSAEFDESEKDEVADKLKHVSRKADKVTSFVRVAPLDYEEDETPLLPRLVKKAAKIKAEKKKITSDEGDILSPYFDRVESLVTKDNLRKAVCLAIAIMFVFGTYFLRGTPLSDNLYAGAVRGVSLVSDVVFGIGGEIKKINNFVFENAKTLSRRTIEKGPFQPVRDASYSATFVGDIVTSRFDNLSLFVYETINGLFKRGEEQRVFVKEEEQEKEQPRIVYVQGPKTIVERIVEKMPIVDVSVLTREELEQRLEELNNKIASEISNLTTSYPGHSAMPARTGNPSNTITTVYQAVSLTNKIDNLDKVTINNSSVTGTFSGLTDNHIPDGITASNYLPLAGGTLTGALTGTDATFETLSVTASTTFNGVEYLFPSSDGASDYVLSTNSAGGLAWNPVSALSSSNWTFFNASGLRPATSTNTVLIGGTSTTSDSILEVIGDTYVSGNVGIGTTSPYAKLSVVGPVAAEYFSATSTTATSTFAGGLTVDISDFVVDPYAGRVGIGTTSPSVLLTVGSTTPSSIASANYYNSAFVSGDLEVDGTIYGGSFDGTIDPSFTAGSVVFASSTGALTEDNSNFFWDDANNRLGIGTAGPGAFLEVVSGDTSVPVILTNNLDGTVMETLRLSNGGITSPGSALTFYSTSAEAARIWNRGSSIMFGLGSSGTEKMRISSAGYVGIGTSTPWAKLSVHGLSTDSDLTQPLFVVATSTPTATTTAFVIDASGNVGIGTSTPDADLHVDGQLIVTADASGLQDLFRLHNVDDTSIIMKIQKDGTENGKLSILDSSGNTDVVLYTNGDSYFNGGDVGIGTASPKRDFVVSSAIPVIALEDTDDGEGWAMYDGGGYLGIYEYTDSDWVTEAERLVIMDGGNVGIGTASPNYKLDVLGATNATTAAYFELTSNANAAAAVLGKYTNTAVTADGGFSRAGFSFTSWDSPATDSNRELFGGLFTARTATAVNHGSLYGVRATARVDHAGTTGTLAGVQGFPYITAGTATNAYGFYTQPWGTGGTYTNWYGLAIASPNLGSATVTKGYGIYDGSGYDSYFSGNVGIGTADPSKSLHVYHATTDNIALFESGDATAGIVFKDGNTVINPGVRVVGDDLFLTTDNTERLTVDSSGNVGIGTTSPSTRLTIDGGDIQLDNTQEIIFEDASGGTVSAASLRTSASSHLVVKVGGSDQHIFQSGGNVGFGVTGPDAALEVENGSATTGIQISNTAADGDPFLSFALSGTKTFTMGVDDGDSDKFKIGTTAIGTNTRLVIDSSGNVGINDTTPSATLDVGGFVYLDALRVENILNCNTIDTDAQGDFSCGTDEQGVTGSGNNTYFAKFTTTGSVIGSSSILKDSGSELTVLADIDLTGAVYAGSFPAAGSDPMCWDGTADSVMGDCSSSIVFKENVENFSLGLETLKLLRPVTFDWKSDGRHDFGFIAEEVELVDPILATYRDGEIRGVKYFQMSALVVKAFQEFVEIVEERFTNTESRLAALEVAVGSTTPTTTETVVTFETDLSAISSAVANYLSGFGVVMSDKLAFFRDIFAERVMGYQFTVVNRADADSSVGEGIITAGETSVVVQNSLVEPSSKIFVTFTSSLEGESYYISGKESGSFTINLSGAISSDAMFDYWIVGVKGDGENDVAGNESAGDTEPPVITINGNNPAVIEIGSSYNDLGVIVEDNVNDNLGYSIMVDGNEAQSVNIDTSETGVHEIVYTATDQAGNTATATREVIVYDTNDSISYEEFLEETATTTEEIIVVPEDTATTTTESLDVEEEAPIVETATSTEETIQLVVEETTPETESTSTDVATTTPESAL